MGDFTGKIISGDFNNGLLKVSSNKLLGHMIGYTQVVNERAHISGTFNALLEQYDHDHDAVRVVFQKNEANCTITK